MTTELHLKYRPSSWDEVLGQGSVVKSIRNNLKSGFTKTFLFTGPSGVGKTTLARLIAKSVGCSPENVIEIDGATNTGIDDMRAIANRLQYVALDGSSRCVIVDECHALSKQSFQSLLKILEEPPVGVYWVLCTTEADRVPKQIKTRCAAYFLKPVDDGVLLDFLEDVREEESLKIPSKLLKLIVEASSGSPRQALVFLAKCGGFKKAGSIKNVLEQSDEPEEVIALCRLLLSVASGRSGVPWGKIAKTIKAVDVPAESVRIIVLRYMNSVLLSGNPGTSKAAIKVMQNFSEPFLDREGTAPLTMACRKVCGAD